MADTSPMRLPPDAQSMSGPEFITRFPEVWNGLVTHIHRSLGATTREHTRAAASLLADMEASGKVQYAVMPGGEPAVFTMAKSRLEPHETPMAQALVSYFDQSGSFNESTGEVVQTREQRVTALLATIETDARWLPEPSSEQVGEKAVLAFLADVMDIAPDDILDRWFAWRQAKPDTTRSDFFEEVVPPDRLEEVAKLFAQFRVKLEQQSLGYTPATLDEWLTKEYPAALDMLSREATVSKRIVLETLQRWVGAGVLSFVHTKHQRPGLPHPSIAGMLPDGWPEFTNRTERAIQRVFSEQFKIISVGANADGSLDMRPESAVELQLGNRPGAHSYMRAIEAQYSVLTDLIQASAKARAEGRTEFNGMSIRELFDQDVTALKRADTYCWFTEPIEAVQAAGNSLPVNVRLTRDLVDGHTGWWYFVEPQDVKTIPGDERVQALLWSWVGTTLLFSTYVKDTQQINGRPTMPSGMFPTSKFSWVEGETLQHALVRCEREHDTRYSPEFKTANPDMITSLTSKADTLTAVEALFRFFIAGCLWLQQTILVQTKGHIERHARKRMEKPEAFNRSLSEVQIIQLRRRESVTVEHNPDPQAREWTCRWVVRGFWRNQFYPSKGSYAPKWIDPFVKGPADKPLKVPNARIYAVNR